MTELTFAETLDVLVREIGEDETTVLAKAMRTGVSILYRQHVIGRFVAGTISRAEAVAALGPKVVEDLEYQRDALARDIAWGLRRG